MDVIVNRNIEKQLEFADSIIRSTPLKALEIAEKLERELDKKSSILLECLYIESKSLWLLGRFEESIIKSNHLSEVGGDLGSDMACARSFNLIGNVFFDLGNFEKALENYTKALSLSRFIDNKLTEGVLNNNIGEIYNALGAIDEALSYYMLSLKIAIPIKNNSLMGTVYLNLANLFYKKEDVDEAVRYVKLSLDALIGIEDYFSIANAHSLLAKIHRLNKEYDNSYKEFSLAIEIMHRIEDKLGIVKLYEEMINFLIEEDKLEEAIDYAEDGLEIATGLNVSNEISGIALLLAKIYEIQGDYKKSLDKYKQYAQNKLLHDDETNEQQKRKVTTQLSIEKLMHDKEIYRLKNVELKKKSDEIQQLYESVRIINNIGRDITSTLDIEKIIKLIYININMLMDASFFGLMLYDSEKRTIKTNFFSENGDPVKLGSISVDDEGSIGAWCIRNKKEIFSNDFESEFCKYRSKERRKLGTGPQSKSVIVLPLITQGEIIGAVTVQSVNKDVYTDYHYNTFKALASYITIAIKNSQESYALELEIKERIKSQKELEMLNIKLSEMSYLDALTNIPNRRRFVEYFERELMRAKRNSTNIALLIIDIDFFKEYNDNYGHVEGDKCIAEVAAILKKSICREVDFVARYGGDEFVVVLSDTDLEGAKVVAEKMRLNIRNSAIEHKYSRISDILTITIGGIGLIPDQSNTVERLIHLADSALYNAKDLGRNKCVFYNEMRES